MHVKSVAKLIIFVPKNVKIIKIKNTIRNNKFRNISCERDLSVIRNNIHVL
jgi:hypothetical protein